MTYFQFNKLMQGNPVDIRHQVTLENWRKYPFTKWSFVNVRNIIPNAEIQTCNNQAPNFDKNTKIFYIFKLIMMGRLKICQKY